MQLVKLDSHKLVTRKRYNNGNFAKGFGTMTNKFKALPNFSLKLRCFHWQLTSYPLVTISTAARRLWRRVQFRALCC